MKETIGKTAKTTTLTVTLYRAPALISIKQSGAAISGGNCRGTAHCHQRRQAARATGATKRDSNRVTFLQQERMTGLLILYVGLIQIKTKSCGLDIVLLPRQRPDVGPGPNASLVDGTAGRHLEQASVQLLHKIVSPATYSRLRDAAHRLVRTSWARHRIRLIAAALLQRGSLTGDEIGVMIAADA